MKFNPTHVLTSLNPRAHSLITDRLRTILFHILTVLFIFKLSVEAVDEIPAKRIDLNDGILELPENHAEGDPVAMPATEITDSSFKANWELAQNAISHRLDVALDASFGTFVSGFEDLNVGNATTWLVGGLDSGVTYYYRIRALYNEGDPTQSNTVTANTPLVPGEQKWVFETDETLIGGLALGNDGAIIFAANDGFLYSIDSDNGFLNWRTQLGLTSTVRPSIGSNGVIFVSGYAIDSESGTVIWQNGMSGNEISIGPDGNLILNSGDSIRAINAETGNALWAFDQASDLIGASISEQLLVYFAGTQFGEANAKTFKIFAVDYLTGKKAWEYELESGATSPPIVGEEGNIYCPTFDSLTVLNASGILEWETDDGKYFSPIITEAGDIIGGSLNSINIKTRTENWSVISGSDLPENVFGPTIGDDGIVYATMLAGGLWAFDSTDGSVEWTFFQLPNEWPVYGPLIGRDGTVFFGTSDGKIYAVNSSSSGLQDSQWPAQARNNANTSYGPNNYFFYSPNRISVGNEFQWIDLEIASNMEWELQEDIPWVFLSQENGEGDGTVSVVIEKNQSGTDREDILTIGDFELPISQSGLPAPVALAASNVSENAFLAIWEGVDGASKYFLDISENPDFDEFVDGYQQRDVSNSTNWFVEGLNRSTRYYYRFRAQVGSELSIYSNVIFTQTLPNIWELSLSAKGNIGGGVEGSGLFEDQTEVTIRAVSAEGYKFFEWQEGETTFSYNPVETFTITGHKELTARFKPAWNLQLIVEPEQAGSVTGGGAHIQNEPATIIAVPNASFRFTKWRLGDSDYSINAVDTVVSDADLTLTACFEKIEWVLTTTAENGSIIPSPDLETYDDNAIVSLRAKSDPGYRFDSWGGDAAGEAGLRDLIMNGDKHVSANFVLDVPENYQQWLDMFAPGESDPVRINSSGDLDFDGLPNYLESVLGTSFQTGDQSENPGLLFQEDGQAVYRIFSNGPLQNGRLFIGISSDLSNWQWAELFFGSGTWVSSSPDVAGILETQMVEGSTSKWKIDLELVGTHFGDGTIFIQTLTSDTAP